MWIDIELDAARPGAATPSTASRQETDRRRPDPAVRAEQDTVWDEFNRALDDLVADDGTVDEHERPASSARAPA